MTDAEIEAFFAAAGIKVVIDHYDACMSFEHEGKQIHLAAYADTSDVWLSFGEL